MSDINGLPINCDHCEYVLTVVKCNTCVYIQPCPNCLDNEREMGREEGYDDGNSDGHAEGYDTGFSEGWDEGNIEGLQDAGAMFARDADDVV